MEQITITAKIQLSVIDTDKVLLDHTMSVQSDACNYVSDYVFRTHDLKQFSLNKVIYKAKQNQSSVIKVNPRYTSQCCPMCGHIEKANRNKKVHLFSCKNCGYKSNDDRIGAMNLYRMGINYLEDSIVPNTVTTE